MVLDSSFVVALHNLRDVHHSAAVSVMDRIVAREWEPVVLLEYVFVEVVTVLLARRGLDTAARVAGLLLDAREIEFVPCSDLFVESFETFRQQPRGTLSFTDAAIATVARRARPGCVATFDEDFRSLEGVTLVPR